MHGRCLQCRQFDHRAGPMFMKSEPCVRHRFAVYRAERVFIKHASVCDAGTLIMTLDQCS